MGYECFARWKWLIDGGCLKEEIFGNGDGWYVCRLEKLIPF